MFYSRLKKLMDAYGDTAFQLAAAIGISRSTITAWKNGETEPNLKTVIKICNHYRVSLDYFRG